jgi:ATP-dependent Clp protease ATP-binding subunit ClpC
MNTQMQKSVKKGRKLDLVSPTRSENEMAKFLGGRLIGQSEAVEAAVRIKTRALSPLRDGNKCAGFYYFIGEPGVGKSELMKLLALYVHGNPNAYVKLDGGSLAEKHQAAKLIGAPTGYKGYQEPDDQEKDKAAFDKKLEELQKVDPEKAAKTFRRDPRKLLSRVNLEASRRGSKVPVIFLFIDEADKLHQTVDDLLLNAIEDGLLSLADNEEVNFSDIVVVMAGNTGSADVVDRKEKIGFVKETAEQKQDASKDIILAAMKSRHRPEFLDRLDEVIFFRALGKEDLRSITSLRINEVVERFMSVMPRGKAFTVSVKDSARDFILDEALSGKGNARKIKRSVKKLFTDPLDRLCSKVAEGEEGFEDIAAGDLVNVSHSAGSKLDFEMFEDEGDVVDADSFTTHKPDSTVAQRHLGDQRKISAASKRAMTAPKKVYAITVGADNAQQMIIERDDAFLVLKQHLGLEVVFVGAAMKAPWKVTIHVEATEEQYDFIKDRFSTNGTIAVVADCE